MSMCEHDWCVFSVLPFCTQWPCLHLVLKGHLWQSGHSRQPRCITVASLSVMCLQGAHRTTCVQILPVSLWLERQTSHCTIMFNALNFHYYLHFNHMHQCSTLSCNNDIFSWRQCFWDGIQIRCTSDLDKVVTEDAWTKAACFQLFFF